MSGTKPQSAARLRVRRGLAESEAAVYLSISPTFFRRLVEEDVMPRPRLLGTRRIWDIDELDVAFWALPREGEAVDDIGADVGDAKLAGTSALDREQENREARDFDPAAVFQEMEELKAKGPTIWVGSSLWLVEEWTKHVRGKPLGRREIDALRQLASRAQHVVRWRDIKGAGETTLQRLLARLRRSCRGGTGFLGRKLRLTAAGRDAAGPLVTVERDHP